MDFEANVWDVSADSSHLTDRLFGEAERTPKAIKKAKKRKSKSPSDKSASPSKKANISSQQNNTQIDRPSLTSHNKNVQNHEKIEKKNKVKQSKSSQLLSSSTKLDNVNSITQNSNEEVSEKKRKKNKFRKSKPSQSSESGIEVNNVNMSVQHKNEDIGEKKGKKKKLKNSKLSLSLESEIEFDNSSSAKSISPKNTKHVGNESLSSTQSLTVPDKDSGKMVGTAGEKKKKKRKRKCKKNKFKDYSLENEEKKEDMNVTEKSSKTVISETVSAPDVNTQIKEKKEAKKRKKMKNRMKREMGEDNASISETKEESNTDSVQKSENGLPKKKKKNAPAVETISPQKGHVQKVKSPFNHIQLEKVLSGNNSPSSTNANKGISTGSPSAASGRTKPQTLLEKSKERLKAARFRFLNEQMYTSTGNQALKMFKEDQEAFTVYHEGFQSQVAKWPTNPIDVIIDYVKSRPQHQVVADFGCGDAKLSRSVPNRVHSFDLVALHDSVTVCDMSKVPLKDNSIDIAVFCLSLMGTNLISYLQEANRVLRPKGTMKIAEVTSRFKNLGAFILQVEKMGFKITDQDSSNKMFVLLDFRKTSTPKSTPDVEIQLSPCVYKKR